MENQITAVHVDETMYASGGKRFANFILDWIFVYIISFSLGLFLGVLALLGFDGPLIWISQADAFDNILLTVLVWVIYYGLAETISSRSIAKFITGTKVVLYDGAKPDAKTILIRTVCRFIPFEAFSFLGSTARGWHDAISDTYVVDVKKYEHAVMMKQSFEQIGQEETTEFNN